uniref:Uncharacterized protein n=1 Tax=Ixodes ricinus TaxID=34613 RepID=A0A6B0UWK2_IXORI
MATRQTECNDALNYVPQTMLRVIKINSVLSPCHVTSYLPVQLYPAVRLRDTRLAMDWPRWLGASSAVQHIIKRSIDKVSAWRFVLSSALLLPSSSLCNRVVTLFFDQRARAHFDASSSAHRNTGTCCENVDGRHDAKGYSNNSRDYTG